jgi:hypothetical protein
MAAAAFAILLAVSWQKWANLTIDGGREMNTPLRLLGGERIYADVYYTMALPQSTWPASHEPESSTE